MLTDSPGLMSVEQVAASLGVHVRTVRRYIHEGRLQAMAGRSPVEADPIRRSAWTRSMTRRAPVSG